MVKNFFAAIAIATSATAVTAFAVPAIADTYYYAAGTRQSGKPSQTSPNEWRAFLGQNHVPEAYTVQYPRDLAPLIGTTTLDDSVDDGVGDTLRLIGLHDDGQRVVLVGVSQGAVVMARAKQALIADPDDGIDPGDITVVTFGDPVNPDGGFLSKLDRWNVHIPGFAPTTDTPGQGGYETFAIEYDLIADSPDTLNPLSWVNAIIGGTYDHASYSKALIDEAGADNRIVGTSEEWYASRDDDQPQATYQHNLIKQKNLPLTRPLRDIGTSIADDRGDIAVNHAVDRLDNLLRPVVDAGYDGGRRGGSRHVSTVTKHYPDGDETIVAAAAKNATPKKPVRDAAAAVGNIVKKIAASVAPKAASAD